MKVLSVSLSLSLFHTHTAPPHTQSVHEHVPLLSREVNVGDTITDVEVNTPLDEEDTDLEPQQ